MPQEFKEFAVRELEHAKQALAKLESGEWTAGPELRTHYEGLVRYLKAALGISGGRDA